MKRLLLLILVTIFLQLRVGSTEGNPGFWARSMGYLQFKPSTKLTVLYSWTDSFGGTVLFTAEETGRGYGIIRKSFRVLEVEKIIGQVKKAITHKHLTPSAEIPMGDKLDLTDDEQMSSLVVYACSSPAGSFVKLKLIHTPQNHMDLALSVAQATKLVSILENSLAEDRRLRKFEVHDGP